MANKSFQLPDSPIKSKFFEAIGDSSIVKWDVLGIENKEKLELKFESRSSNFRQGVWLMSDEAIEIGGSRFPQVVPWQDTAPNCVDIVCHSRNGLPHLYNVWDSGRGRESQAWQSGVRIQEVHGMRRYECTDAGPEVNFASLVFTLRRQNRE